MLFLTKLHVVTVSLHFHFSLLCMYFKGLKSTDKYIKYLKYIADYLSVSTSTFLNIELNLSTSTSTAKTVLKCT